MMHATSECIFSERRQKIKNITFKFNVHTVNNLHVTNEVAQDSCLKLQKQSQTMTAYFRQYHSQKELALFLKIHSGKSEKLLDNS